MIIYHDNGIVHFSGNPLFSSCDTDRELSSRLSAHIHMCKVDEQVWQQVLWLHLFHIEWQAGIVGSFAALPFFVSARSRGTWHPDRLSAFAQLSGRVRVLSSKSEAFIIGLGELEGVTQYRDGGYVFNPRSEGLLWQQGVQWHGQNLQVVLPCVSGPLPPGDCSRRRLWGILISPVLTKKSAPQAIHMFLFSRVSLLLFMSLFSMNDW